MPFTISGNLDKISQSSIVKFQKSFGVILSHKQFPKQQFTLIQNILKDRHDYVSQLGSFSKTELMSFIFILSQFGDVIKSEAPENFQDFENNPYVIEWQEGMFMIPWELLDFLSTEKVFREQNYLFALLVSLSLKEKKAWMKWLEKDCEYENEKELTLQIYRSLRTIQKKFQGKSIIHEKQFELGKLWIPGTNRIMDWYYKGLTPFYFTMQEMAQEEQDPFFKIVLEEIKAGKYILKKEPEKFREKMNYILVSTIEGQSVQFRETMFNWEIEKNKPHDYLFYGI
ncbi:MAG: hypothetical protein SFU98_08695 [Leptospiraceae bacterium]|nr:hypothetical protein [Leptospiraceae bacterium]